jgi:hypothetical protein
VNDQPHVHDLVITNCRDGGTLVEYGDQALYIWCWPLFPRLTEWRVRRAARRVVLAHDRESQRAGARSRGRRAIVVRSRWANEEIRSR